MQREVNRLFSSEIINCNTNIDCFISASESCKQSKLTYNFISDMFGFIQTTKSYYELKGIESDKCKLLIKIEDVNGYYSEEGIENLKNSGMTEEEIAQQETELNDALKETIGTEQTCKFTTSKLKEVLIKLKNGEISSADWEEGNCI